MKRQPLICPGDWLVKIQITVCVMSIIQIDAIFKMVKERASRDDLGLGEQRDPQIMFFTLGNNKYQSNTWMSPNSLYIFCPDIAFSSQALNPYPLHSALIASNMNSKKDCVFVYVCTLLRSFISPCPNASLTCLIYWNLATRTTRSLYTLTSMYKWPLNIALTLFSGGQPRLFHL